ncbi:SDR family oxidoreductase [uncultured Pseudoflavonifractor sp.]|uniref:SDR family oxidoreductase n=1 Tax=uncultured Pseudoflavonifractor sp. TaxID=1221379 RepID=UPI0025F2520A|nr:SDR family oxidoreductase [uncultured Pseudoflavonifractor sp.]
MKTGECYAKKRSLEGKVAVITGAGSGIGKASVSLFLREGAVCVAADLNYDSVAALQTEYAEFRDRIKPFKVNVADSGEVEAMIDFAVRECGKMDILFNNAGVMDGMLPIDELSDDKWKRVMDINATGVMYACRKAVRYYLERGQGGVILNTASLGGLCGGRAGLAYTASKFAVVGMTKNIAFMYGDVGIRCNAICPGGIQTNIGLGFAKPSERGIKRTQNGMGLMDRLGDPFEIAAAAVFLSCDAATFINGATLTVDGGWSAY